MICYVLAMGKQHIGPHVVVGYGIKIHYVTRSPGYYCVHFSFAVRGTEQHGNATDGYTKEVGYLPKGSSQKEASDKTNSTQSQ